MRYPPYLRQATGRKSLIKLLSQTINVNGQDFTPTFRYEGKDATTEDWSAVVGSELLAKVEDGPDFLVNQTTPFGRKDKSVKFNGSGNTGDFFQASSSDSYEINSEDFIFEILFEALNGDQILGTRISDNGYSLNQTAGSTVLNIEDGLGNVAGCNLNPTEVSVWQHAIYFCDKSEAAGFVGYVNGGSETTEDPTSIGDVTNGNALSLGAGPNGTLNLDGSIAYVALWKCGVGGLDNSDTTEIAAIAASRSSIVKL